MILGGREERVIEEDDAENGEEVEVFFRLLLELPVPLFPPLSPPFDLSFS